MKQCFLKCICFMLIVFFVFIIIKTNLIEGNENENDDSEKKDFGKSVSQYIKNPKVKKKNVSKKVK